MPRAFFPHTLDDVARAVDGGLGLVVGDMPDGTLWVLKRNRREGGHTLTHWADAQRSRQLSTRTIADRADALDAMAEAIGLGERVAR